MSQALEEPEPADAELAEPTGDEMVGQVIELEAERRRWLRSLLPYIQLKPPEDAGQRVDHAYGMLLIAACERAQRIIWTDLPPDQLPPSNGDFSAPLQKAEAEQ